MATKTYTSFAEFKALKATREEARKAAIKLTGDEARKAWDDIEEMEERLDQMYDTLMPEVGMPATMNLYSDRRAMTIVSVINANTIVVTENDTKCLDWYGNKYEILDTISDIHDTTIFSRRKNGRWVEKGQANTWGSVSLTLGYRVHSIDPSF